MDSLVSIVKNNEMDWCHCVWQGHHRTWQQPAQPHANCSRTGLSSIAVSVQSPNPNVLLQQHIYSARHETRSCKDTSFARPSHHQNPIWLQSFLGLINYLQPFLPSLASKTTFLREQVTNWDCNPSNDQSFHHLKSPGFVIHFSGPSLLIMTVPNP